MKLGVITDCFKKPTLEEAFKEAHRLGLSGVQIYATKGSFSPDSLTPERKAEIKESLRENHLEVSALCGDMGGFGYQIAEDNPERIEKDQKDHRFRGRISDYRVVTTHIGVIPADKTGPSLCRDALRPPRMRGLCPSPWRDFGH
jgi:L-ribulose-5-phosphate 3-epimerase